MDKNLMIAYTEVNEIINLMDEEYQEKIPQKLRQLISETKLNDYKVKINPNIPLKEQQISKKALAILAVLNYNYWCISDDKKKKLINQYIENEEKYQEKLKEVYNQDNLFKNRNNKVKNDNNQNDSKELIEYNKKETFWKKLINKIKKWIKLT